MIYCKVLKVKTSKLFTALIFQQNINGVINMQQHFKALPGNGIPHRSDLRIIDEDPLDFRFFVLDMSYIDQQQIGV